MGGFLTIAKGWRWNFWFVAIIVRSRLNPRPVHNADFLGWRFLHDVSMYHEGDICARHP